MTSEQIEVVEFSPFTLLTMREPSVFDACVTHLGEKYDKTILARAASIVCGGIMDTIIVDYLEGPNGVITFTDSDTMKSRFKSPALQEHINSESVRGAILDLGQALTTSIVY